MTPAERARRTRLIKDTHRAVDAVINKFGTDHESLRKIYNRIRSFRPEDLD